MNQQAPVIFIGHGSPMNAVATNSFTQALFQISQKYNKPQSVLMVSAHWMTKGSWVTGMKWPKTIHDFYGFPKELFEVQYPAPGNPELAETICKTLSELNIKLDVENWGLDHGTWSVMRHIFPDADIPIVQLSIDLANPFKNHYQIGKALQFLRSQGVWIMGSGNVVHNLQKINWNREANPYEWAIEFDEWLKQKLIDRNDEALISEVFKMESGKLSIPTPDHYIPLLYVLGAKDSQDRLEFVFEGIELGSISMRTMVFTK